MAAEKKVPYEFLARWDAKGVLTGAHVGFRTVITLDDGSQTDVVGAVMPVDVGGVAGFPLQEILDQLHVDAIARGDNFNEALRTANHALSTAQGRVQELEAEVAALKQDVT